MLIAALPSGARRSGATWSDLGPRDLGEIHDLALGIDGAWVFLATERGLWRLPLR